MSGGTALRFPIIILLRDKNIINYYNDYNIIIEYDVVGGGPAIYYIREEIIYTDTHTKTEIAQSHTHTRVP